MGRRALLGLAIALTGSLPVLIGGLGTMAGVDPFVAFGVGAAAGGGSSALVAFPVLRRDGRAAVRGVTDPAEAAGLTGLVAGNLFLTANMVAVPAVLRLHVDDLTPAVVASLQIAVSLSRLSTLLVGNAVSVVVAAAARHRRGHLLLAGSLAAGVFGLAAALGTAAVSPVLLPSVFGAEYGIDFTFALLASLSVLFLNPGYVLTGWAVARHRTGLIAASWAGGAAVLSAVAVWPSEVTATFVLLGIALSALIPLAVLALGLHRRFSPAKAA